MGFHLLFTSITKFGKNQIKSDLVQTEANGPELFTFKLNFEKSFLKLLILFIFHFDFIKLMGHEPVNHSVEGF